MTCRSARWLLDRYGNATLSMGFLPIMRIRRSPKSSLRHHPARANGIVLQWLKLEILHHPMRRSTINKPQVQTTGKRWMKRRLICLAALCLAAAGASAQPVSFKGKTVTMIIGYPAGGGTDISGRLIAAVLAKHLPGEPTVTTQNMPGAEGMMALNYFVRKPSPTGSRSQWVRGRKPNRPITEIRNRTTIPPNSSIIGGVGRGGSALIINRAAEPRLYAQEPAPVIMGTTSGAPRTATCRWRPGARSSSAGISNGCWDIEERMSCSWRSSVARSK